MKPLSDRPARAAVPVPAEGPSAPPPPASPFRWPVDRGPLLSGFGDRRVPGLTTLEPHHGADLAGEPGAEVRAAAAGRALYSGFRPGFAGVVVLQHEGGWQTVYGNLGARSVAVGDAVAEGSVIGRLGGWCDAGGGSCLHFEVRHDGAAQDPAPWIGAGP